ncbi:DUF5941 domain-containing protein [Streptomyces alkaliterrae]|uniref:DUF5941 domain-containing protein n=1 Tax=Streptomyces alkaliterrae TaxID=2213162 RepID=UPI001E63590C|nr:DUF5941 domain-containing protein [Streptomyces alkaliterrae]
MPTAVLTSSPPDDLALTNALRELGYRVGVADRLDQLPELVAEIPADQRVAVVDGRFVGHRHSLRLALLDSRPAAAALPGVLSVAPAARADLDRALARRAPTDEPTAGPADDHTAMLAAALERGGVPVRRPDLGPLVAAVPTDAEARAAALRAVDAVDEEAVRLRSAVKDHDGFFTTFFVSPYSRHVARWCARRGLSPDQVTTASLLVALTGAACAATGTRPGYVTAALLLLLSFVLDCADGQLARYAVRYSRVGAWLDATFDRAKEYAFYAGLALGAARSGDDVWALALAAMAVLTVRHVMDAAYHQSGHSHTGDRRRPATRQPGQAPGWTAWPRRMVVLPIGERWALLAALTALTTPRTTFVVLLLASVPATLYTLAGRLRRSHAGARGTARAGAVLRTLTDSGPLAELLARPVRRTPLARFPAPPAALGGTVLLLAVALLATPDGPALPLAAAGYALLTALAVARPPTGRFDWLVPALFRAAEYGLILVLAQIAANKEVNGALPAAFGLVAALAYHHYDTVHRIRGGTGAPPRWLVRVSGGHEGRTLLVSLAAVASLDADRSPVVPGFASVLTALAVLLATLWLVESVRFQATSSAPATHDESGEPA